jgi:LDH2 family malate/lactate/ureidoglycolate dehydrogenase
MELYDVNSLREFTATVMTKVGLSKESSAMFADSLIEAEMRGIPSHGLTRLKTYVLRVEKGLINSRAEPKVLSESTSLLLVDAENGMGVYTAHRAMERCILNAKKSGACFASVRGGNHFGIGSFFADFAARNDMIGLAMTNGPAALAPTGGKKAILGTNPLAISIPAGNRRALSLDMSTSIVARGKVTLAKKEGYSIPEGWAIDAAGCPTTDPATVACMLPFGGAKGYGIGLVIEILCSCLSGAANGITMGSFYDFSGKVQNVGFFLGAIDISSITPIGVFKERMDNTLISSPPTRQALACTKSLPHFLWRCRLTNI